MQTRKNISVLQRLVTTLLLALNQSLTEAPAVSNDARLCLQAFSLEVLGDSLSQLEVGFLIG